MAMDGNQIRLQLPEGQGSLFADPVPIELTIHGSGNVEEDEGVVTLSLDVQGVDRQLLELDATHDQKGVLTNARFDSGAKLTLSVIGSEISSGQVLASIKGYASVTSTGDSTVFDLSGNLFALEMSRVVEMSERVVGGSVEADNASVIVRMGGIKKPEELYGPVFDDGTFGILINLTMTGRGVISKDVGNDPKARLIITQLDNVSMSIHDSYREQLSKKKMDARKKLIKKLNKLPFEFSGSSAEYSSQLTFLLNTTSVQEGWHSVTIKGITGLGLQNRDNHVLTLYVTPQHTFTIELDP